MRIALAQTNPLVGDLSGNAKRLLEACLKISHQTQGTPPALVVSPELSLWGYPPRDLLLSPEHLQQQSEALTQLQQGLRHALPQTALLVGMVEPAPDQQHPRLFNAAALVEANHWRVVARKQLLPTYDVFDESRYFRPADQPSVLSFEADGQDWRLGLTICEDLWVEDALQAQRLMGPDPVENLIPEDVDLLLNLSASPYGRSKASIRHQLAARAAQRLDCPVIYVNQVGGNDELVFDGGSFVVAATGEVELQLPSCREAIACWDSTHRSAGLPANTTDSSESADHEQLFQALVLGVRDYADKCGFQRALLGLSGGIDSALVAVIATAALGADRVQALLMPSPWSSIGSIDDAEALSKRLGISTTTVPIQGLMHGFEATLTPALDQAPSGVTAENLQSRIRGTLLMAVANQQGQLLLSTGNKSELAVGYCTLYGDMNGGLAVIGDLYKSTVFSLCRWLDSPDAMGCRKKLGLLEHDDLIGLEILNKPPSAELRPDQQDSDSLPDYATLDPLLKDLIEKHSSGAQLIAAGHDAADVKRIEQLFRRAEFKRRQAPPVLKVSQQAFGTGWRLPIASR
ncbi:NAD synthetase [Synechococcus sp. WH 8020]|uniref:NAD+ synthase n=1 Tax=Synechococcus sp. (strain WH8020) TaxID=32052 RepID=UPI00065265DB|nr:NAD+ synthase [Synechococcus sp. WH 8020]AKN61116.1 NAD synthetase [Synechococcus sp. WH 8020]